MSSGKEGSDDWGVKKQMKFSGKGSEWQEWSVKFMATARMRKYHKYYKGQVNVPSKEPDETEKEELKIYEGNMNAWAFLCLHLTGTPFSLVIQQENDSEGAWNSILKKYHTKASSNEDLLEATESWKNCQLDKNTDPDDWFTKLYMLNKIFKDIKSTYEKDEFEIMSHIYAHLPEEYKPLKTIVRLQWATMNLENLKEEIIKFWKNDLNGKNLMGRSSTNEGVQHALYGDSDNNIRKKGKCHYCGKEGHFKQDCRTFKSDKEKGTLKSNSVSSGNGAGKKCNHCGKTGHLEAKCWKKHGKPGDNNNEVESMFVGLMYCDYADDEVNICLESSEIQEQISEDTEFDNEEYCLVHGSTIDNFKEFYIGDSGATGHMTNDESELTHISSCNVKVTVGDGNSSYARKRAL